MKKQTGNRFAAILKKFKRGIHCPVCTNGKMILMGKADFWVCQRCDYKLSAAEYKRNPVFWYCDKCRAYLNTQDTFDFTLPVHTCEICGFENEITADNIVGICIDCGKTLPNPKHTLCSECKQKRNEKRTQQLEAATTILDTLSTTLNSTQSTSLTVEDLYESEAEIEPLSVAETIDKTIYTTNEWKGHGKQNYYWHKYRQEGNLIVKYKCHRQKIFDGNESAWIEDAHAVETWSLNDTEMPEWLRKHF